MKLYNIELGKSQNYQFITGENLAARRKNCDDLCLKNVCYVDDRPAGAAVSIETAPGVLRLLKSRLAYLIYLGYRVRTYTLSKVERQALLHKKYPELNIRPEDVARLRTNKSMTRRDVVAAGLGSHKMVSEMETHGIGVRSMQILQILMRYGIYVHIQPPRDSIVHRAENPIALTLHNKMEEFELDIEDVARKSGVTPTTVRRILTDEAVSVSDLYAVMQGVGFNLLVTE